MSPNAVQDRQIVDNQNRLYQLRLKLLRQRKGLSDQEIRRNANDPTRVRQAEQIRRTIREAQLGTR